MPHMICPKCGKSHYRLTFYNYAYKDEKGFCYCSWTCYHHRNDGKIKKEIKYKVVEAYDERGQLIRTFKSANEAAEHTGFCIKKIQKACHEGTEYNGFLWKYKV